MTGATSTPEPTASVLTLVRGRERQLANLVAGLAAQRHRNFELVVAAMQREPPALPDAPFPVRVVPVAGERLPLAAARNRAAAAARSDRLIFLDVDCIPSAALVGTYAHRLSDEAACYMGEVRYLPHVPEPDTLELAALERLGRRHVSKPAPPKRGVVHERDHGELWGLSFALRRESFCRAGGFDERFEGYGGEETDFAATLAVAKVGLYRTADALAFHQAHPVHIPPLHHFADIVRNAALFRAKWGRWCMDYWLGQFAERGFVAWSPDADEITVVRPPTAREIAASRAPPGTLYS